MGIDVIVAPYEADAQLAYLNRSKIADYVITEDSDLVLFGCHHVRNENESFIFAKKDLSIILDFI
jgi:exonuclease-1